LVSVEEFLPQNLVICDIVNLEERGGYEHKH